MNGTCRHCSFSPCGSSGGRGPFGRRRPCVRRPVLVKVLVVIVVPVLVVILVVIVVHVLVKVLMAIVVPVLVVVLVAIVVPVLVVVFVLIVVTLLIVVPITIVLPVIVVVLVAHMSVELFVWVCVSKTTLHLPFQETQSLLFLHS